jgi:TRAP-type transport system periplasmic protein
MLLSFRRLVVTLAATVLFVGMLTWGEGAAHAATLKIGTLAPAESPWGAVFKVWQKGVKERTNGALELQFFYNAQQGDEVAMVGKMRTGQLDGAALTATGLSQVYKHVLVLQMPGLFTEWETLDKARNAMRSKLDAEFDNAGFRLLGWGDVGIAHAMTKGFEARRPADLKHKNLFYFAGDPVEPMVYSLIGDITPTQLSVPEVLPALTSNKINAMTVPAIAAEQLQWASRLDHINTAAVAIGIGALIVSSAKVKALPPDVYAAMMDTGKVAAEALTARIRREDAAAYARLKARMTAYEPSADEKKEWAELFKNTRLRLKGAHFKPDLWDEAHRYAP